MLNIVRVLAKMLEQASMNIDDEHNYKKSDDKERK